MKHKCLSNLPHQVRNTVPLKFYIGRDTSRIRQATVGGDPVWRGERIGSLMLTFFDVRAITLAEVLDKFAYERCSLVCDIEGGEADLVRYEAELLAYRVQTLIVEVHPWLLGETSARNVISDLERLGFANVYQEDNTHVMQNCSR